MRKPGTSKRVENESYPTKLKRELDLLGDLSKKNG
jgi:hypothetical protein